MADTLGDGPETFAYNSRMWLGSIQAGNFPNYTYKLSVGYAGDGSVTSANDSVNGNMSFTYDNLNRLATMSSPSNPSGCYGLSWSYDGAGNRTAQSVTSGSCPASSLGFNTSNPITSPTGYQYDAAGNLSNDTAHSYTYHAEGRMLTVDGGNGVYVYDAFGRRIEKTAGGSSLVYLFDLAGREIAEVNTSGANPQGDVYAGSRHLVMYANNTTSFFQSDQLGTERVRTTVTGTVDETCTSLPFGDNQSCTTGAPLGRFAGYERDNEYSLAHAPARYYSPAMGRFLMPDPFGTPPAGGTCSAGGAPTDAMTSPLARPESLNRYAYVTDNPTTYTDPSGKFILATDCFLDAGLLPECLCDPENGCPPALLLLLPPPPGALLFAVHLKRLETVFGLPKRCSETTKTLKDCGICCDEANLAHGLICAAFSVADPFGLGEVGSAICEHFATEWGVRCAQHCLDEFPR